MTRGSIWRRWDPHLHAPGTLLNDQFGGDWEAYMRAVETADPPVEALGVTDYFSIRTYREVRRRKAEGRLPGVSLLFPNVELRLDIKTDKARPINLHLLFSPDDDRHEDKIERALSFLTCEFQNTKYKCSTDDLAEVGRLVQTNQRDHVGALRAGAQQFKVELSQLRDLFRTNEWVRMNCLVAVAGGRQDGTAGLQADDSYALTRREIESFAQIIFASTPSQRRFWLGQGPATSEHLERTYKGRKPCIHGSDAHTNGDVLAPDRQRYTWLKGDPTFETLRQAVIEPEERVWIGDSPPVRDTPVRTVDRVSVTGAPWLGNAEIDLNPGLVAIIGERGSGKTALVEIISRGAQASQGTVGSPASFLHRATSPADLIGDAAVALTWSDGSSSTAAVRPETSDRDPWDFEPERVRYLSQQFVDQLCSATGLATKLREEIEGVIFEATPRENRYDATSFPDLAEVSLEPIRERRRDFQDAITQAGDRIEQEDEIKRRLPKSKQDLVDLEKRLDRARKDLAKLLPAGKDERARRLVALETACTRAESALQTLRRREQRIRDLVAHIEQVRTTNEPARRKQMKQSFAATAFSDEQWAAFGMEFIGDVGEVCERAMAAVARSITLATDGDLDRPIDTATAPLEEWPLTRLQTERDKVKGEVGIDAEKQTSYNALSRTIAELESAKLRLETEIQHAAGAEARRTEARQDRQRAYAQVFGTFADEEHALTALYAPLAKQLGVATGAVAKLAFTVERHVDVASWVGSGEELFDLRTATQFREPGLATLSERYLMSAWRTGDAHAVAAAMQEFVERIQEDVKKAQPPSVDDRADWLRRVARWMYSTEHVSIRYAITYDGVRIENLSPGTRGIVLLLLYLVLDQHDERPLVIDQPEENLDPKSVFEELVPHFRAARKRRQVIIVTHNANLVVNTDADQVLIATAKHVTAGALPTISYAVGTLEDRATRARVCAILEGGERAFLEREKRYRLRWGEQYATRTEAETPREDGEGSL